MNLQKCEAYEASDHLCTRDRALKHYYLKIFLCDMFFAIINADFASCLDERTL